MNTDDLRISRTRPLLAPAILAEDIPRTQEASDLVQETRSVIEQILSGRDERLLVIVGPCSIHDLAAAREYAMKLQAFAETVAEKLMIVMRVYFEKPRTVIGWKGLIHDPDLDESYHINKGLRLARQLLADLIEMRMPVGTEFLDTTKVSDEIKFIFVDWLNNFPHKSIKSVIPVEDDFHKLLLFLSINHPLNYPLYCPLDQFSKEYELNKSILDFFLENVIISTDFGFKFFKIRLSENQLYYFRESDKFEKRLKMILDEFIQSHSYLHPIQSAVSKEELEIQSADVLQKVTLEVSKFFFNSSLKSSLLYFIKEYMAFLHESAQKRGYTDDVLENYKQVLFENIARLDMDNLAELERKKYKLTSILRDFPRYTIFDKLKKQ